MDDCLGLVIADDLTGATDTGHQFAERDYRTVVTNPQRTWPESVEILVVNTDSRYEPAESAYNAIVNLVNTYPDAIVYKKIDSTLRGNIRIEIDAILDTLTPELAIVAPAFPDNNRITVNGIQLKDGIPSTNTETGQDSLAEGITSYIPNLLAESNYPIEQLSITDVVKGQKHIQQKLERLLEECETTPIVVCDALTNNNLYEIASACAPLRNKTVFVGSAGLAKYIQFNGSELADRTIVGVVGSVSNSSLSQLSNVNNNHLVQIDTGTALTDLDTAVQDAVERCRYILNSSTYVIVTGATSQEDVKRTLSDGRKWGLDKEEIKWIISQSLARTAATVHANTSIDGLFATGGDIAVETLNELNASGVQLTGYQIESGIPLGHICGGDASNIPIITKAGDFGSDDTLYRSIRFLRQLAVSKNE